MPETGNPSIGSGCFRECFADGCEQIFDQIRLVQESLRHFRVRALHGLSLAVPAGKNERETRIQTTQSVEGIPAAHAGHGQIADD